MTLYQLLDDQKALESFFNDGGGEITDDQDIIWLNQEVAIKDKIDSYGFILSEMEAEKEKIDKTIKKEANARIKAAVDRIDGRIQKLKSRLNHLSEGSPLRGHTYSFHPYIAKKRTISDITKLDDSQIYVTIEIRKDYLEQLLDAVESADVPADLYSVKKETGKLSDLPEDHPAIETVETPSVRIT